MRNTNTKHFPLFWGVGGTKIHNKSYGSWISYSSLISHTWKSQRLTCKCVRCTFHFLEWSHFKIHLGTVYLHIRIFNSEVLTHFIGENEAPACTCERSPDFQDRSLSHSFWTMPPHKQDLIHAKQQNESTSGIYYNHLFSHF